VGGSLAHSDPAAEYPAVAAALDAELVIRGPGGERVARAAEFFVGLMTTALQPGEMLVEVRMAAQAPNSGWAFEEFSRRHGDFAIVGIAALVAVEGDRCSSARLAACGAGPTAMRLRAAEEILEQSGLADRDMDDAAARAAELVDPGADLHASVEYRRHLTRVLTRRALVRAVDRARGASAQSTRC
jgi:CO/xanthine dehydrogenase FAD-binding subunit